MLHALHAAELSGEPSQASGLLELANESFGCDWGTLSPINYRRGWLQSAALIELTDEKRLQVTQSGLALLDKLQVEPPTIPTRPAPEDKPQSSKGTSVVAEATPSVAQTRAAVLAAELRTSAVESSDPSRFEIAVRDAFEFLGFRAEQLGGSGKADVLLDAPLGKNHSYRVTVEVKSVGAGTAAKGQLRDGPVDWPTLQEHREKHGADHSLLIGPNPTGGRILSRAKEFSVAVISSDELAQLCLQHEELPLGLNDYKSLFSSSGSVDTSQIDQRFDESLRRRDLAQAACRSLIDECAEAGPMSARDLWWALKKDASENAWERDEIQRVLKILASDLVGAIAAVPDADGGPGTYIPATSLAVAQLRLRKLAEVLGSSGP